VLQLNLRAVSQPPEGAAVKLLPIRWLARGVAVAYCAFGACLYSIWLRWL